MKKKKGFTLIELIGAIVILAIISMLITPIFLGVLNNSKHDLNDRQLEYILDAAQKYGVSNFDALSDRDPNFVTIDELYQGGYIEDNIIPDLTNPEVHYDGCIMIMYSYKRQTYEYKYLKECNADDYSHKINVTHDYTSGWVKKVNVTVSTEFSATDGDTYFKYCSSTSPICSPNKEVRKSSDTVAITGPQGEHVYACAVSIADTGSQSEVKCVGPFKIDTQGPTLNIPGDENLDSLTTAYDFNAGVSATDNFTPNNQITINKSGNISLGTLGSYELTYTATDLAGNTTTRTRTVTVVDVTKPTISISVASNQFNSNGWSKNNVNATVQVNDTGGSGSKSYTYCVTTNSSGTPKCTPSTTINSTSGTITMSNESKTNYVCAYATDGSGNKSATSCSGPYKIDKTAPDATYADPITIGTSVKTYSLHTGVTYTDNLSTASELTKNISSSVSFGVSGSYTITHTITDLAGNTATKTRTLKIVDDENPSISLSVSGNPFNASGWATGNFNINVNTSDEGDGIASYTYCKSTSGECTPGTKVNATSGTIDVSSESTSNWVCAYSTDKEGNNSEKVCVGPYKLDKHAPVVSNSNNISFALNSTVDLWSGITYSDNLTATSEIVKSTTGTVNNSVPGQYTINYSLKDKAGLEKTFSRVITIDPTFDVNPVINGTTYGSGSSGFTFDVYVNNVLDADNVTDYCKRVPYNSTVKVRANDVTNYVLTSPREETFTMNANKVAKPTWINEIVNFTITYNPNGGAFANGQTTSWTQNYSYNNTTGALTKDANGYDNSNPTRTNYVFAGWNPAPNENDHTNQTVTAAWDEKITNYTITYDPTGGTFPATANLFTGGRTTAWETYYSYNHVTGALVSNTNGYSNTNPIRAQYFFNKWYRYNPSSPNNKSASVNINDHVDQVIKADWNQCVWFNSDNTVRCQPNDTVSDNWRITADNISISGNKVTLEVVVNPGNHYLNNSVNYWRNACLIQTHAKKTYGVSKQSTTNTHCISNQVKLRGTGKTEDYSSESAAKKDWWNPNNGIKKYTKTFTISNPSGCYDLMVYGNEDNAHMTANVPYVACFN